MRNVSARISKFHTHLNEFIDAKSLGLINFFSSLLIISRSIEKFSKRA